MTKQKMVDVSYHNGKINWEKVKKAGYHAIIRCGFGQDEDGQDDTKFEYNSSECERLGIPYGVYLYSYASSATRALGEAEHAIRLCKGKKLSYPLFIDLEESKYKNVAVDVAKVFCNAVEKAGFESGVYANKNWWDNYLKGYDPACKWVARYNDSLGMDADIWQYSSSGTVSGISGKVDMNHCYIAPNSSSSSSGSSSSSSSKLAVDGDIGVKTVTRAQKIAGTTQDGKISKQRSKYKNTSFMNFVSGCVTYAASGGSEFVGALQKKLGITQDKIWGTDTTKALQEKLGVEKDGYFGDESAKAWQKALNNGQLF